jgi:hypothetical protein
VSWISSDWDARAERLLLRDLPLLLGVSDSFQLLVVENPQKDTWQEADGPAHYRTAVPERLFVFIQIELPRRLGPADGRYLLRARPGADPERVVVLQTEGAAPRARARKQRRWRLGGRRERAWRGRALPAAARPAQVATTRATVIDPVSLSAESQAQAWLEAIEPESEILGAFAVLDRVLFAYRIAGADPSVADASPAQALTIRAGWGSGEDVASGRWRHARELHWADARPRRRVDALRPQERFSALLGGRGEALICEELALRARLDLDHGRVRHAAVELERAYAAALRELQAEGSSGRQWGGRGATREQRLRELEALQSEVTEAAAAALGDRAQGEDPRQAPADERTPDDELVRHALSRLEAALRARAASM